MLALARKNAAVRTEKCYDGVCLRVSGLSANGAAARRGIISAISRVSGAGMRRRRYCVSFLPHRQNHSRAEMDTDRVHSRIGSGRVGSGHGSHLFLPHIFMHFFHYLYSCCCRLIDQDVVRIVNRTVQRCGTNHHIISTDRPVGLCGLKSGNQQWLQVMLWVVLRRDSAQRKTEQWQ